MSGFFKRYEAEGLRAPICGKNFHDTGLRTFLKEYAAIDLRSLERLTKCRALQWVNCQDVVRAASTVKVRLNCADTLAAADKWTILSANWSKELVSLVLTQHGIADNIIETTQIIANQLGLKVDEVGVTTGGIDMKVQSSIDKARWIGQVRSLYAKMHPTIFYVKDSVNDLLALLEADVGIWLASDSSSSSSRLLHQLAMSYGIAIQPISTYSLLADEVTTTLANRDSKPVISTMTDWVQLQDIVEERLQQYSTGHS